MVSADLEPEIVQPARWISQGAKSVHFRLAEAGGINLARSAVVTDVGGTHTC